MAEMDMKEKLVELIQGNTAGFVNPYAYEYSENAEQFADYLIANGVTVQEWISVKDRLPDNKEHDWVLAQVVEDN